MIPEINARLYQEVPITVENGATYRLQCDYHYSYQFPGSGTFTLRAAGLSEVISITMNAGSGSGDATGAGGTFMAIGTSVVPQLWFGGDVSLDPENGDFLSIEVTNISLKKV